MDEYLTKLSDGLAPTEFTGHGDAVMDRLFRILQTNPQYRVDRQRLGGGLEKKTSLKYSVDYDVVVFLNDVTPDMDVLKYFREFLCSKLHFTEKEIKINTHSLKFTLDGVDFDLLFARNMVKSPSAGSVGEVQHAAVLKSLGKSRNPIEDAKESSSALTEAAVDFVKQQNPFVHKVARLAKYWNSTIFYTDYLSGRSSIFELLGIDAGREEEKMNPHNSSIRNAFRRFLERVKGIDSLKIAYYTFYNESDVPLKIRKKTPRLLDPSSPYNNFMDGFSPKARPVFRSCAIESLDRLDRVHDISDLKMLFFPQPRPKKRWSVSIQYGATQSEPKITPLKGRFKTYKEKFVLKWIKMIISAYVYVSELEATLTDDANPKQFAKDESAKFAHQFFE